MFELCLVGKYGSGRFTSLDDEDNYPGITTHNWCIACNRNGHERICRGWGDESGVMQHEYLSRVILERKLGRPIRPGWECHHLDGDPIGNNHRDNLMELPKVLHMMLQSERDFNPSSPYRWVSKHKNGWQVKMKLPNGKRHSKTFKTELEATVYADELFIQYYGHWFFNCPELDWQMWLNLHASVYPAVTAWRDGINLLAA